MTPGAHAGKHQRKMLSQAHTLMHHPCQLSSLVGCIVRCCGSLWGSVGLDEFERGRFRQTDSCESTSTHHGAPLHNPTYDTRPCGQMSVEVVE